MYSKVPEGGHLMTFINDLYIGGDVENIPLVIKSLRQNIWRSGIFCICLSPRPDLVCEIISARDITSERYAGKKFLVIGIARGKKGAVELFSRIMEDYVASGGTPEAFKADFIKQEENL